MTDKLDKVLSENTDVWKNKSAFMNYLRGGLRKSLWSRHPVKIKLIKDKRERIPNPNPKGRVETVWGGRCELCDKLFAQADLQVDHIREDYNRLNDIEDIQKFVEGLSIVTTDELRLVCKPCHGVVSHSQKNGVTFEVAKVQKDVIALKKDDNLVVEKLKSLGVEDIPKTKKAKNELLTKLMMEGVA